MAINKFSPSWQNVRVKAKKEKDVSRKIQIVLDYVKSSCTEADILRVLNWLKTTAMGYVKVSPSKAAEFNKAVKEVETLTPKDKDNNSSLKDLTLSELIEIQKDLKTRKYNFQFKKVPVDHTSFMNLLENEIKERHGKSDA